VGNTAYYDDASGEFYMDPGDETLMIPPREDLQYNGDVVVLVGPACASACEFFSYNMTVNDRATIVGQYPSDGAGGSVEQFLMPEDTTVQMTIGRAVDADGNIHLEGKGVVPDVKVPVTFETLQQMANGEDVVLDVAQSVVSQPAGAGVTPSGPPEIATREEASSAFASGENFLEGLAREEYNTADYAKPGTLTFTVPLDEGESPLWLYAWCTATTEILDQNFQNIKLKFMLDGVEVPLDQLANEDLENNGQQCRLYYTALSNWPAGEHHLSITSTFTKPINDGFSDYEAGDYVLEYNVFVRP
jgi:hypothetical protein